MFIHCRGRLNLNISKYIQMLVSCIDSFLSRRTINLDYVKLMLRTMVWVLVCARCTRYCESSTIVLSVAKSHNLILANVHGAREFTKKIADNSGARYRSRIPR